MKNIAIIDDEAIAAQHLERLLRDLLPQTQQFTVLQSIEEAVEYFQQCTPDLAFVDIHLADGLAFGIFEQVNVTCPVFFTTAYDQYALEAFRAGGIDYLLKPIDSRELRRSLDKLINISAAVQHERVDLLVQSLRQRQQQLLVQQGDKTIPVDTGRILYIYLVDRIAHIYLDDGSQLYHYSPLIDLMEQLPPELFFRANRQFIVAHRAVKEIVKRSITRLALTLVVDTPIPIELSRSRSVEFKQWYTNTQTI